MHFLKFKEHRANSQEMLTLLFYVGENSMISDFENSTAFLIEMGVR